MNPSGLDLASCAANLEKDSNGIWVSRRRTEISYPEEGNLNCLALEADSFWFAHRSRCILSLMRRCPARGTLLDVGGGNGYVAASLQQAGLPVALLEPGRQGVLNARKRGVETLICSTLEDAGFYHAVLPAVGLFDVLEHIQADVDFLRSIHTLLQPGGRLYLTVPAYRWLWSADDDYAGHYRRYTRAGIGSTLRAAGFEVLFGSYFFFMLPLPIFLMRVIPSRLGMRKQEAWDSYQQEHKQQSGLAGRLLARLLDGERGRLENGRRMLFGGSLLVAAEKR